MSDLSYAGSHPVSRLSTTDPAVMAPGVKSADLFAFSTYKVNDMAASARPMAAFTFAVYGKFDIIMVHQYISLGGWVGGRWGGAGWGVRQVRHFFVLVWPPQSPLLLLSPYACALCGVLYLATMLIGMLIGALQSNIAPDSQISSPTRLQRH